MTPKQLMSHYTTQAQAGAAIGIGQGAVGNMIKRNRISPLRQLQWERATDGRLKADPKILTLHQSQR